ncbi:unnamed protein product [Schistocephalus solidus]|uniref:Uncharacterized protein n=1 Tax=Schistocephalus solidus TaxID=70667 RepID=A0A183SVP5_SCHSO|nr:unnamed protein product [Schistocephalus solidus]
MLLWPPLVGTQRSLVAPRSWVLPSGHIPGHRHDWQAKPDNPRKTVLVVREPACYKVDIAALSETQFSEKGVLEEACARYSFFCSSRQRPLLSRGTSLDVLSQCINGRLTSLRLPPRGDGFTTIISTCALPQTSSNETKNKFIE